MPVSANRGCTMSLVGFSLDDPLIFSRVTPDDWSSPYPEGDRNKGRAEVCGGLGLVGAA